jgi:hypothetical protein
MSVLAAFCDHSAAAGGCCAGIDRALAANRGIAMPDFLPRQELELLNWSRNFDQQINADPEAFGLSPLEAAEFRVVHEAFAAALMRAIDPATRTTSAVIAKNDARDAMKLRARKLANRIRGTSAVSAKLRVDVGVRPRKQRVRRVAPPDQPPSVVLAPLDLRKPRLERTGVDAPQNGLEYSADSTVTVKLFNAPASGSTARADGAFGATIFTFVGEDPPPRLTEWTFHGQTTRTAFNIDFGQAAPGSRVWVTARWFSHRGEPSAFSRPVGKRIAGRFAGAA